jgi:hypothetical protein
VKGCLTCGRLAVEPGEVVGYAGPLCQCIVMPKIQRLEGDDNSFSNIVCDECKHVNYFVRLKSCPACDHVYE